MKINIKATNMSVSPAVEEYLTKKLESLNKLMDFESDTVWMQVELAKTTNHHKKSESIYRAEVNLHFSGKEIRSECETADIYSSIDMLKDDLAEKIKNNKEKKQTMIKKGGAKLKEMMHDEAEEA